jgi:TatD DNase family protein
MLGKEIPASIAMSCGLHPWNIKDYGNIGNLYNELKNFCQNTNVVAVGETGLDKLTDVPMNEQEEIFRIHIEISNLLNKPLIIHCVKATDILLQLKKDTGSKVAWIYHGFNSSAELAEEIFSHGIYISIGSRLLANRKKLKAVLERIPLSGIFAETDDDVVSIADIYENIADLAGIDIEGLKELMWGNYVINLQKS